MQYSSPKMYLKELKIQLFYAKKFLVNFANHNDMTSITREYVNKLEQEIDYVEVEIAKQDLKKRNIQMNIYDFIEE